MCSANHLIEIHVMGILVINQFDITGFFLYPLEKKKISEWHEMG